MFLWKGMEAVFLMISSILVSLLSFIRSMRKPNNKKSLPGPMGLPIVGYIPFLKKKPYAKLAELSELYGPIYSLPLGSKRVLVITDFEGIKEAFENDAFAGRPPDLPMELSKENLRTKAFIGSPYKEQRRFFLRTFRDLGLGKTRMEEHMKVEILDVVDRMSQHATQTTSVFELLASSLSNNIASLLFGRRMRHDDPARVRLNDVLSDTANLAAVLNWQFYFPWIRKCMKFFGIGNQGRLVKNIAEVKAFCRNEINAHEETLDANNIVDFTDGYLLEIQKRSHLTDTPFTKEVLTDLCRSFLGAGSGTVRLTLDWALLLCASRPDHQSRIRHEIDEVLGPDRFPTQQDKARMPYTEAAICEVMRWKTIIPINTMRFTLKDTELKGYFIPKATEVLSVPWAVDHNKSLWGEDVFEYRPERFLSADGKRVVKPEHFMPFSIGKRYCPGKSFAEIEVFLFLTTILQKFDVRLPEGKEADFEGVLGIGHQPKRQNLYFKYRH